MSVRTSLRSEAGRLARGGLGVAPVVSPAPAAVMALAVFMGLAVVMGCGGGGRAEDAGPTVDGSVPEPEPILIPNPASLDTFAPTEVSAGEILSVSCTVLDEDGEVYRSEGYERTLRIVPEGSVERDAEGRVRAVRAGRMEVSCGIAELGLTDDSPAVVDVRPGEPAEIVTEVDRSVMTAGESIAAGCLVFDGYGNFVPEAEPRLRVAPRLDGNEVTGLTARMTRAGTYELACELTGTTTRSRRVEVQPALPADIVVSNVPDEVVYGIGQVVEVASVVTDRFGNRVVGAPVAMQSDPPGSMLGGRRFRYAEDGTYVVTARVMGATDMDVSLAAETVIVVNGTGPAIRCGSGGEGPADGAMVDAIPGEPLTFTGSVADANSVAVVTVGDEPATLAQDGTFTAQVPTSFGVNFVDVVATDGFGVENSRTCSFVVSNRWVPETDDASLADALSLGVRQAAFDDRDRDDGLDSLNDMLETVINSDGLRDALHEALLASNPLKPSACDVRLVVCLFRSRVDYRDSALLGPHTTRLELIDGGLHASLRLEEVFVRLHISGTLDTDRWVRLPWMEVELDFDTFLDAGRPRVNVDRDSVEARSASVDLSPADPFTGEEPGALDSLFFDALGFFFDSTFRGLVEDQVRNYVREEFDAVLDDVIGGLDVRSLGASFEVARLDEGSIPLSFGVDFSSLGVTPERALFGIGTSLSAPPAIATPSRGAAIPPGSVLRDPGPGGAAGVSLHLGLFNQALHALWRGGLLEASLDRESLGGSLPEGVSAELSGKLPPVADMHADGRVEVGIGALEVLIAYPELFREPVRVSLGARASTTAELAGEDLAFDAVTVNELFFSTTAASLDSATRDVIEGFLRRLVEQVVGSALNEALPTLPIPTFPLPASLAELDLPVGAELGIMSPMLARERPHFVLRGGFGVR